MAKVSAYGGTPPPRAKCHPTVPLRQPPPRPRFALLPRPLPGARAVMAISRGKPCPGSGADAGFPGERESGPESGSSPGSPRALHRGGYRPGGGAVRGDTGDKPSPGRQTPGQCEKRSILSSVESTGNWESLHQSFPAATGMSRPRCAPPGYENAVMQRHMLSVPP